MEKEFLDIRLRRGEEKDIKAILFVMEETVRCIAKENKRNWFVSDDEEFIREHISKKGFTLVAEAEAEAGRPEETGKTGEQPEVQASPGESLEKAHKPFKKIVGFLIVKFPGLSEKNLGRALHMEDERLLKVAHMDSAAVLPEARGWGLQKKLIRLAEETLKGGPYTLLMATVHPENRFSLQNMLDNGYEIKTTMLKYGGLPRHVLLKEISHEES